MGSTATPSLQFWVFSYLCLLLALVSQVTATEFQDDDDDLHDDDFFGYQPYLRSSQRNLQSSSTTSTTERVNVWGKLKESLGTTIVGILLIIVMPCLIWKNEGRHVRELKRIDFCRNKAVQVDSNNAGDDTVGSLVYFTGTVQAKDDTPLDFGGGALNLTAGLTGAVVLRRTCYIYQKMEHAQKTVDRDRVGGGETRTTTYTVKEDWTPMGPGPAQLEHLPQETNDRGIWDALMGATEGEPLKDTTVAGIPPGMDPKMMAMLGLYDKNAKPHATMVSPSARVGDYGLSPKVILEHEPVFLGTMTPVPTDRLPVTVPNCPGLLRGSDNILRTFLEGNEPRNGDCKVVYEYVQEGFDCSFIVQQTAPQKSVEETATKDKARFGVDRAPVIDDKCFGKCPGADSYGDIWMVRRGTYALDEMIDMAKEDEGKMTKLIRIVGWVLMFAGWVMLFAPLTTMLSTLPILGSLGNFAVAVVAFIVSCTCCVSVMTVAYIRYRPLIAMLLLALSVGIWGIVTWRLNDAAEEGEPQS